MKIFLPFIWLLLFKSAVVFSSSIDMNVDMTDGLDTQWLSGEDRDISKLLCSGLLKCGNLYNKEITGEKLYMNSQEGLVISLKSNDESYARLWNKSRGGLVVDADYLIYFDINSSHTKNSYENDYLSAWTIREVMIFVSPVFIGAWFFLYGFVVSRDKYS